jgi:hypothetical protein
LAINSNYLHQFSTSYMAKIKNNKHTQQGKLQNEMLQNVNSAPGMVIGSNMNSLGILACSSETLPNDNNRLPTSMSH